MTTLEIVRFTVAASRQEEMLALRPAMEQALRGVSGCRSAVLARLDDGTYVDVVTWNSREQALAAAAGMQDGSLPQAVLDWAATLDDVQSFEHAEVAGRATLTA